MMRKVLSLKIKRVYHPYYEWEELKYNMWGDVDDTNIALQQAIDFTSDHLKYGEYMLKVLDLCPISCENHLTNINSNRKAWIGHCAVAIALGIPEDITRKAWGFLTDEQRILANRQAQRAIDIWERDYFKSKSLYKPVAEQMLFEWNT